MPDPILARVPFDALAEVAEALRAARLPADDLNGSRMTFYRLADERGALGWAALERHGPDALLRSVLTVQKRRSCGIGSDLVRRVGALAADDGVERLWLLTETAAPFFARLGFAETERAIAPAAMQQTSEFRRVCPASAVCMTLTLVRS